MPLRICRGGFSCRKTVCPKEIKMHFFLLLRLVVVSSFTRVILDIFCPTVVYPIKKSFLMYPLTDRIKRTCVNAGFKRNLKEKELISITVLNLNIFISAPLAAIGLPPLPRGSPGVPTYLGFVVKRVDMQTNVYVKTTSEIKDTWETIP